MSFILQDITSSLTVQSLPATIEYVTAPPYFAGGTYTWNITNYDSYVTYTVSTTNGSVSLAGVQIVYTPSTAGSGGFEINQRSISLTISNVNAFFTTASSATNQFSGGITNNSNDDVFITGYGTTGASNAGRIIKFNSAGTLQWQFEALNANTLTYNDLVILGTDLYVAGSFTFNGLGLFAKFNSAGTLQTMNYITVSGGGLQGIASDGVDLYLVGSVNIPTDSFIAKYNTSGVIQWQRTLSSANSDALSGVVVDGSNLYAVGYEGTSPNKALIAKYSNAGVIQWQRTLVSTANSNFSEAVVDTSGNVYVIGSNEDGGIGRFLIVKYNSSGVVQWQRTLLHTSTMFGYGIAIDSSNNIYVAGGGSNLIAIAKYNSSGVIQWQRSMSSLTNGAANSIKINNNNKFILTAYFTVGGVYRMFTVLLPDDGSATGTYTVGATSFTYGASSFTDAAVSFTAAAGTLVDAAGTVTTSSLSPTTAASTLTIDLTQV